MICVKDFNNNALTMIPPLNKEIITHLTGSGSLHDIRSGEKYHVTFARGTGCSSNRTVNVYGERGGTKALGNGNTHASTGQLAER